MIPTKCARSSTLAGFALAGKLSHSYRSLLPALALCLTTAAWSQSTLGPKGPHRPSILSGVTRSVSPAADASASSEYKFITIVNQGAPNTQPYGVSNARLVTGYYQDASSNYHGFVWQDGALQTVDYPGAAYTYLYAVNNLGVAIGYYGAGGDTEHAVMYSVSGGTWTALPDVPGYSENEGYGINDAGFVVGNAYQGSTNVNVAWTWNPNTSAYSFFSEPGAAQYGTFPSGINDKGQVVGSFCTTEPCYDASFELFGFLKEGAAYSTIQAPGAPGTYVSAINNSGTMVGQWQDFAYAAQGFVLTSSGLFTTVDYPGPTLTGLNAINDYGDITGVYVDNQTGDLIGFVGLQKSK
jgi:hypothetical protein